MSDKELIEFCRNKLKEIGENFYWNGFWLNKSEMIYVINYVNQEEIEKLREKNKKMREVLSWYADGENYDAHESQSYVVWQAKEECSGGKAEEILKELGVN